MFSDILKHRSGRVIALGRTLLALIFLIAIRIDPTQPAAQNADATYVVLATYAVLALGITFLIWDNWWLDAKLAAPAHFLDMAAFALLVYGTSGYTSPFFLFFVFLILCSAIRWGLQETALTAGAVTVLYLAAGYAYAAVNHSEFDLPRFIIRGGHLLILSAILTWFGVNHGFSGAEVIDGDFLSDPSIEESPLETALSGTMESTGAKSGVFLWRKPKSREVTILQIGPGGSGLRVSDQLRRRKFGETSFLFKLSGNRALRRTPQRRMKFFGASEQLDRDIAAEAGIDNGLAIPVRTDAGEGQMLLGRMDGLCTDHIDVGDRIAAAVANHIQRHALISAINEGAAARARLALSRDLHDGIVQFLAGATFKVEAMSRSVRAGGEVDRDLNDLKRLLLEEQRELRSSIGALRNNRVALGDLASSLSALCERLARQWDVECEFTADVPDLLVPMRLHLDSHQLVREAVANAVRHAHTSAIHVALGCEAGNLTLDVSNEGEVASGIGEGSPWSLRERVNEANGTLMLASREGRTMVSVSLPLGEGEIL